VTDVIEETACGINGCAPVNTVTADGIAAEPMLTLEIDVISDAICPWCWVGKRRLDRALAALAPEISATVSWKPFELNPGMPKAGLNRREYRSRKFGTWEHSQALDAQVASVGSQDGLEFRHDLIERTPNTLDAHRLIWLAGREGLQDAVVEGLFSAYFHEGRDVGDHEVLLAVGSAAGLNPEHVSALLASDKGITEVRAEIERAGRLDVSGVPTVVVNGRSLFSGAIRPQLIEARLRDAASAPARR
jgi:predicted DsbA family dithiol-disulfide isomerase